MTYISTGIALKRLLRSFWSSNGFLWRIARIMVLVFVGILTLLMAFEDKLIYFPSKYPDGAWAIREICGQQSEIIPEIEDCYFSTSDGVRLHGWFCTPLRCEGGAGVRVKPEMLVLWFHGNAGNITNRYDMMRAMMKLPVDVLIIDYRGYGRSEGKPTEQGLYLDARAAWDFLINQRQIAPERIVIFGKSLGGAPAIDLASKVEAAGLIVQSSFTSAGDMAATVLPFFPRLFLHTKMNSIGKIPRVRCPKLFLHSRADEVVPFELGRRLYEAAPEPKFFYEVKGAPHNSTYIVGGASYFEELRRFIESCHGIKQ